MSRRWKSLQAEIEGCEACPRLREYCREVARTRRRMYRDEEYWGRPVPSFGPADARLLILGLAPAAHGANRTGRMFTGDSSGDWLYEALHRFGFANQPTSTRADDGLRLRDCVITAAAHCAPPANRPDRGELETCRQWLRRELALLRPELVLVLGRIAWETWWRYLGDEGHELPRPRPGFAHGKCVEVDGLLPILQSYHPSRQNTNTGRLTRAMWHRVFAEARKRLDRA
jgi:uracil-DNA glycosylase family 4